MRNVPRPSRFAAALLGLLTLGFAGRYAVVGSAVGAGFAAHVTCSLAFVSGADADGAYDAYVQHLIWPLGHVLSLEIDENEVVARVFGVERARALYQPGAGCTQLHAGLSAPPAPAPTAPAPRDAAAAWPFGSAPAREPVPAAITAAIDRAFSEPEPDPTKQRLTKAVIVTRAGQLIAERYAPGVDANTRLLSWSAGKSVLAALVGAAVRQERMTLAAPAQLPQWSGAADARRTISLDQLLRMSSGLEFDERYGATNAASVMLFGRSDSAAYAAAHDLDAPPDSLWNYSSGTTNLVSNLLARTLAVHGDAGSAASANEMRVWAQRELFVPLGADSALFEADAAGTLLLSSFVYMTARDWARFGELHRNDGVWRGERLLPEGWVDYISTPTPPSHGQYGAHWWLNRGTFEDPDTPDWPGLPRDTFAARGMSGQYVIVIPSEKLVIVRLGLTSSAAASDGAAELAEAVVAHYRGTGVR